MSYYGHSSNPGNHNLPEKICTTDGKYITKGEGWVAADNAVEPVSPYYRGTKPHGSTIDQSTYDNLRGKGNER